MHAHILHNTSYKCSVRFYCRAQSDKKQAAYKQPAKGDIIAVGTSEMSESVSERRLHTPGMI